MGEDEDENPNKDRTVQDHVLCALFGWLESGAKEDIKKLVTSVFSFEEIKDAMLKFCDPVTVLGTTKPKNLQKSETCFDEIWSQWEVLHKSKHLPRVVVDIASFMKLPMVRPGETRSEVSFARIAALEAMVTNLFNQNKAILETVEDLKKKVTTPLSYAQKMMNHEVGAAGNNRGQNQQHQGQVQGQGQGQGQGGARSRLSSNNQRFFRERADSAKRRRD